MKTPISVGLRAIPLANRRPGRLAKVARYGKPNGTTRQDTTSTSFEPRVILPDPRLKVAKEALRRALANRVRDLEDLIADAADVGEAIVWQGLLKNLLDM